MATLLGRMRICTACRKPGAVYGPLVQTEHDECRMRLYALKKSPAAHADSWQRREMASMLSGESPLHAMNVAADS